jgi:hypothetical protein
MNTAVNPFTGDKDREQIWEMLVRRDIEAFVSQDWSMVADDSTKRASSASMRMAKPTPTNGMRLFQPLPPIATSGCVRPSTAPQRTMPNRWHRVSSALQI